MPAPVNYFCLLLLPPILSAALSQILAAPSQTAAILLQNSETIQIAAASNDSPVRTKRRLFAAALWR